MREELAAQQAGRAYADKSRLNLDAAEITSEFPSDLRSGHAAWLAWPWKLHRISGGKQQPDQVTWELYNLSQDPMETKNLLDSAPERAHAMQAELDAWMGSVVNSLNGKDYRETP
jgi:hypothetical protein